MKSVDHYGMVHGIIKVIPPKEWYAFKQFLLYACDGISLAQASCYS